MTAQPHKTKPAQPLKTKPAQPPKERPGGLDQYPNRKTLIQRGLRDCCWPVTSGAPWFYCGERVAGDGSYCSEHLSARRSAENPMNAEQNTKRLIRSVGSLR